MCTHKKITENKKRASLLLKTEDLNYKEHHPKRQREQDKNKLRSHAGGNHNLIAHCASELNEQSLMQSRTKDKSFLMLLLYNEIVPIKRARLLTNA